MGGDGANSIGDACARYRNIEADRTLGKTYLAVTLAQAKQGRKDDARRNYLCGFSDQPLPGVVFFVGATDRANAIDPVLRRSGRFSKTIHFDLPDAGDREAVISGYLQRIERSPQIDLSILVQDTAGRSQADIKTAIQEDAVRLAFFRGKDKVEQIDILDALRWEVQYGGLGNRPDYLGGIRSLVLQLVREELAQASERGA